jgi:hypothetical protein
VILNFLTGYARVSHITVIVRRVATTFDGPACLASQVEPGEHDHYNDHNRHKSKNWILTVYF